MRRSKWDVFLALLVCATCRAQQQQQQQQFEPLNKVERAEVCDFFTRGDKDVKALQRGNWGNNEGLCTQPHTLEMFSTAARICESCQDGKDVCKRKPPLLFHSYLDKLHETRWKANLLCLKSYLMTQDLSTTRYIMWVPSYDVLLSNPEVREFFRAFQKNIRLRQVRWDRLIANTPFAGHPFFSDEQKLLTSLHKAVYADLLRLLALHKLGGVWVDNDVVIQRDWRPLLINVGYQFAPRWMNNHVLYIRNHTELSSRLLRYAESMPITEDMKPLVQDKCEPVGYFPASPGEYGFTDIYNGCVLNRGLRTENDGGPSSNKLYDYPLGWFDPIWARPPEWYAGEPGASGSCLDIRKDLPRAEWVNVEGRKYHAFHTRWPKVTPDIHPLGPKSPLARCIDTLDAFFDRCKSLECVPRKGGFLVDYDSTTD